MRRALIVTNPKWEPFTAASDKFKDLDGDAVLVVRGRAKEKGGKTPATQVYKKIPETVAEYKIELLKAGKKPEEIEKLATSFKPPTKEAIAANFTAQTVRDNKPKRGVYKKSPESLAAEIAAAKKGEAK
jgi:hypothetical protein